VVVEFFLLYDRGPIFLMFGCMAGEALRCICILHRALVFGYTCRFASPIILIRKEHQYTNCTV
jgi:hypothetical protein